MDKQFFRDLDWSRSIFLFILGFILGISLKNIATEKFIIGYNDYRLKNFKSDYSLDKKDQINVKNENNPLETK